MSQPAARRARRTRPITRAAHARARLLPALHRAAAQGMVCPTVAATLAAVPHGPELPAAVAEAAAALAAARG